MSETTETAPEPRQWFSVALERMGATYAAWALEQIELYNEHHPVDDWHVDVEASTFRQGSVTVRMAPLGTFGTDGSWMWAWANTHMNPPGSQRLAASLELRRIGEQYDVPELVTPRLELSEFADARMVAERLLVAATGVLAGRGYGSVTVDTGARFAMLMVDDAIPRPQFDMTTVPRRIMQGIEVFPHDHRATVGGYLTRHGFEVEEPDAASLRGVRPDCTLRAAFDEHGRLADLSFGNSGSAG
ncbi:DUF6882 domain-containing protein [Streptomonospora litoralis]|uniref:Uncharacterized protein n=1 Tax=Streptomonospora litoralis TaxID=2498135 RepID=A0A4P6QAY0_9ACTN|nr:DUF6882 domain-containing protein [Streptomonospora litoralis]QBI56674.1 hypothetical protein EKD16_24650 [Streptomonospora litoralis]